MGFTDDSWLVPIPEIRFFGVTGAREQKISEIRLHLWVQVKFGLFYKQRSSKLAPRTVAVFFPFSRTREDHFTHGPDTSKDWNHLREASS